MLKFRQWVFVVNRLIKRYDVKMKLIEDNSGMFPGETASRPVCSKCGCKQLFRQLPGAMYRMKNCPQCGHTLNWGNQGKVKGGSDGK